MSLLLQALMRISSWIEHSSSQHAKRIREGANDFCPQPGLERELIELYAEEINFKFSEEVYELYQWHNGMIELGRVANSIYFISLEQSIYYYDEERFRLFPIFSGYDHFYAVSEALTDELFPPIYAYERYDSSQNRLDLYAPNLTSYMQAMADCTEMYDDISANWKGRDVSERIKYRELFSAIYRQYGVTSCGNEIWG